MNQPLAFDDALDAAEKLDVEAQAELVAVLSRRLAERGRASIVDTVAQSRREFAAGQFQPMTAAELAREAKPYSSWTRAVGLDPVAGRDNREKKDGLRS